jgi:hypothetical protein
MDVKPGYLRTKDSLDLKKQILNRRTKWFYLFFWSFSSLLSFLRKAFSSWALSFICCISFFRIRKWKTSKNLVKHPIHRSWSWRWQNVLLKTAVGSCYCCCCCFNRIDLMFCSYCLPFILRGKNLINCFSTFQALFLRDNTL